MKKIIFFTLCIASIINSAIYSSSDTMVISDQTISPFIPSKEERVFFKYENKELIDIINGLAQKKGINILLPQGANAITAKVTFSLDEEISISQAWEMLISILDLAGYAIVPHGNTIHITKTDKNIARESLDLFIGLDPLTLPVSDKQIRYIYYFSNIKVSKGNESELQALFKATMPANALFEIDPTTNGVILVGRSKEIQAFMEIALKLDKVEFQEKIEFITAIIF